jgi:hypothetical protein
MRGLKGYRSFWMMLCSSRISTSASPASSLSPLIILDNQTYALCPPASCFVFDDVAYCKCDVEFGDSISETLRYDTRKDVCTVNAEGAASGTYMVSTFNVPESVLLSNPNADQAIYTCRSGSNGAYAQCDGGICFTNTEGQSFAGFDEPLAKNEIICSCPITEQNPNNPVGYQVLGPWPCDNKFFKNCSRAFANNDTGSTLHVGAPTGTPPSWPSSSLARTHMYTSAPCHPIERDTGTYGGSFDMMIVPETANMPYMSECM